MHKIVKNMQRWKEYEHGLYKSASLFWQSFFDELEDQLSAPDNRLEWLLRRIQKIERKLYDEIEEQFNKAEGKNRLEEIIDRIEDWIDDSEELAEALRILSKKLDERN